MHEGTSKLPLVERRIHNNWIGTNTRSAIQNGGYFGCVREIQGYISATKRKMSDVEIILSSADAQVFANYLDEDVQVEPNLVLHGLNEILNHNRSECL
jgi:pantothenate kinase type III